MAQVWHSSGVPSSAGNTVYTHIFSGQLDTSASSAEYKTPIPVAGTLAHFHAKVNSTPGVGETVALSILINGVSELTVSIEGDELEGTAEGSVAVLSGDLVYVRIYSTVGRACSFSVTFFADNLSESCLLGSLDTGAGNYTTYTRTLLEVASIDAHLSNLYIKQLNAPGAGKSCVYTIVKNGVDTDISVTISDSATSGSDLIHSDEASVGDKIALKSTHSDGSIPWVYCTGVKCSILTNTSLFGGALTSGFQTIALPVGWSRGNSYLTNFSAYKESTLTNVELIGDLYVKLQDSDGNPTSPGSGHSLTLKLIKVRWGAGGVLEEYGDTGVEVVIENDETEGFTTATVFVTKGTLLCLKGTKTDGYDTTKCHVYGLSSYCLVEAPPPPLGSPIVLTRPATAVADVSARLHGEVTDDGEDDCEVRFRYAAVIRDDFEWGVDTDPLSDDGGDIDWTISVAGDSKAEIDTAQYYAGTRSARLYRDGANNARADFSQTALSSSQVFSVRVRKDDTSQLALYHGNGTKVIHINYETDEDLSYYDGATHDTGVNITINTWTLLEIRNVDWDDGTYDIYQDGVLVKSGAAMRTSASWSGRIYFYNFAGTSECWIDDVSVREGWTLTDWQNSLRTDDTYYKDISGLTAATEYVFATQGKNSAGEGLWADPLYFTTEASGTRCFTIPDLFDDHGRVAKGAWVRAYRTDTMELVGEAYIDEHGNATICGLPNDVDVIFHVTWGGGG